MCRYTIARLAGMVATFVSLVSALLAQGTWTWQQQCSSSNEWSAICSISAGCGHDQNGRPVHRYFNNWGLSQCGVSPGLPGPGSVCIFPAGANALLSSYSYVDILSVGISNGAIFSWQSGSLTLRNPSDNSPGTLSNLGLLRMVSNVSRYLSGVLVNTGTLVHEYGPTYFNGASLQNSGTAEVRGGTWYNNTGTNSFVNTGTLNKTTTNNFTIYVPMQQQQRVERNLLHLRLVWLRPEQQPHPPLFQQLGAVAVWGESGLAWTWLYLHFPRRSRRPVIQ